MEELKIALEPEFTGFLNIEDTINQICGHFVSIDNGQVSLIHATARQFLTTERENRPSFIEAQQAHSQISIRCLSYLSQDCWPLILRTFSTHVHSEGGKAQANRLLLAERGSPFLGYATCYWAYHVSKSPVCSKELTEALNVFFSQHCLAWFEAIALSANLRYLTRSARYLKIYSKRRKYAKARGDCSPALESLRVVPGDDSTWLQSWAIDIIRIVGKFGPILLSKPSSIYQDILPFCPRDSIIALTYGERRPGQLSVAGLPSDGWDDRLASVSVGDDHIASKVLATEAYFITLISSVGTIIVWHAETCEQARKIEVKEYVPVMVLNRPGTLLATARLTCYAVWELSSGRLVSQIPKPTETRTITLASHDDTRLVVGCDDCSITIYDRIALITVASHRFVPPDQDYGGCPTAMTISPDCTAVAMAWRGKVPLVWHFKAIPYQSVQTRRLRQISTSLSAPEALRWQADGSSLFILCQDTNFVEWRLYDDQQVAYPHLKPREFSISRDGNLVLTSDHTGTISVWTFPRLSLVYQLRSENDFVRDVGFSPDSQCLYDVRDSLCNIWEPDVLIRPDEQDLEYHSSLDEMSLVSSEPALAHTDITHRAVTAMAMSSIGAHYCCGRDDGSVIIHDAVSGTAIRRVYSHSSATSVLQLQWSSSGRYMVSSDDAARVIAKRLEVKSKNKWAVYPVLDTRVIEPVHQFLFSHDERYLLISTSSTDQVYELRTKQQTWFKHWGARQLHRWFQNPVDTTLLVWIEAHVAKSYDWSTMTTPTAEVKLKPVQGQSEIGENQVDQESDRMVVWAACIESSGQILYGTFPTTHSQGSVFCLSHSGLHLESVNISLRPSCQMITSTPEYTLDLAKRIKRLIGTYQGKVVYLDHDHQLCTWNPQTGTDGIKKHFFLPRDWLDASSLELALVDEHGSFLCPKGGYVAIVRNGIWV